MNRRGQIFETVKIFLYFATLVVAANASTRQAGDPSSTFICGPQGIKHNTNQTIGSVPNVKITCPKMAVKMDVRTEITCKVISNTFASIAWFFNGRPITGPLKNHVTADTLTCNQTLKIKFAKLSDGGNYTCRVANRDGNTTKACFLQVEADKTKHLHIEYLKIAGDRKKALLQGAVNLTCNMLNVDDAMWLKNGSSVKESKRHLFWRVHTFGQRGMMFYLEIINVTKDDEGLYTCLGLKNGLPATKTLYLETEPCPHGHYCPYHGNKAFPCPPGAHANNSVPRRQVEDCYSRRPEEVPVVALVTNRGRSAYNPVYIYIILIHFQLWLFIKS